jgi:hypothetical protein
LEVKLSGCGLFASLRNKTYLGTELIANEESVLDLDHAHHVALLVLLLRLRLRLGVHHLHHRLPARHVVEGVRALGELLLLEPLLAGGGVPLPLVQVLPALGHPVIDHFLLRPHLLLLVGVGGGRLLRALAVILLLLLGLGQYLVVGVPVLLAVVRHLHLVQDVHVVLGLCLSHFV